jgi:hypothetical protein
VLYLNSRQHQTLSLVFLLVPQAVEEETEDTVRNQDPRDALGFARIGDDGRKGKVKDTGELGEYDTIGNTKINLGDEPAEGAL